MVLWLQWVAFLMIGFGLYLILRGFTENARTIPVEHEDKYCSDEYFDKDVEFKFGEGKNRNHYCGTESKPKSEVSARGGGVILIGPIPIVFGDSKYATYALVLAVTLMLLSMIFILMR